MKDLLLGYLFIVLEIIFFVVMISIFLTGAIFFIDKAGINITYLSFKNLFQVVFPITFFLTYLIYIVGVFFRIFVFPDMGKTINNNYIIGNEKENKENEES